MSALKAAILKSAAALLITAGIGEAQTTLQDLERKKAELRAQRSDGTRPAAKPEVHCTGIKVDGDPSTYNVDSMGGISMLSVRDATTLALIGMDSVDGKTSRIAGVNVAGAERTVQKVGQACLDQQFPTNPVVVPPEHPSVEATTENATMASTERHIISVDPANRTVTVNDTGVSRGGPVPVRIVIDMLKPKGGGAAVPSGFHFEWDERLGHGDNSISLHRVFSYDGHVEAQSGIDLGKGIKGFGSALAGKGASVRAGNSTDMSMNHDKTFEEATTTGGKTTKTHYGGHDQSDFTTMTGKVDPDVAMANGVIHSLSLDLKAAEEDIRLSKFAMPEFITAITADRGQREKNRMQEIATKAGLGDGPR